jgi:hypothetical protein
MTHHSEKSGLNLIEDAVHLLRRTPLSIIATYYIGTIPFIVGFLYFWTDMSFSADAYEHMILSAFGIALLFLWMKCWHTIFCTFIQSLISRIPPIKRSPGSIIRMTMTQASIQPTGLFVIPLALVLTFPFAWVYSFYQNITVLGKEDERGKITVFHKARKLSMLWPKQNHIIIFIISLFGCVIFINLAVGIYTIPYLLKILFAIDTVFTRSEAAIFNSTYFAVTWALTYGTVDPLIKTIYCLRCFYGEALTTGEDLRASLKNSSYDKQKSSGVTMLALIILIVLSMVPCESSLLSVPPHLPYPPLSSSFTHSSHNPGVSSTIALSNSHIPPTEFDRAIHETLKKREYTWRLPRDKNKKDDEENNFLIQFIDESFGLIKDITDTIVRWLNKIDRWLGRLSPDRNPKMQDTSKWKNSVRRLFYFLLIGSVVCLAFLLFRYWYKRYHKDLKQSQSTVMTVMDISDETVTANNFSTDKWMIMGKEFAAKGQLRFAIRAFYFATLSLLSHSGMITITRFKSNRDYKKQLEQTMGNDHEICRIFSQNIITFNRIWYGFYEVTDDIVNNFISNHEQIRAHIQT